MCFYFDTSTIQNVKVIGPKLGRGKPNGTRDGDGDGKCQEEGGKFIPCPPGAVAGTIFNINKITGDMRAVGNIGTPIGNTEQNKPLTNNEIAASTDWMQQARDKFAEARKNRAEKAQKIAKQADQTNLTSYQKRILRHFSMDDYRKRTRDENEQLLKNWETDNPAPAPQDYENPDDYNNDVDDWDSAKQHFLYDLENGDQNGQAQDFDTLFTYSIQGLNGKIYRIETTDSLLDWDGVAITGVIYDEDDNEIGQFQRLFTHNEVEHQLFTIDKDHQGNGIGSAINAQNEMIYKQMGMEIITTHGVSGGTMKGGTHWPKNGFTWQTERDKNKFINEIELAIDTYQNGHKLDMFDSPEQAQIIKELCEAANKEQFDGQNTTLPADLLNWPGAEQYFKDRRLDFYYKRQIN